MPRIGPYSLYEIECGRFRLDGGAMFGIIPRVLWAKRMVPDDRNRIHLYMRSLLLVGDGRVILIDTGAGNKYSKRFQNIYALSESTIDSSLGNAGYCADDITDVILTHLHFDHAGGSTEYRDSAIVPKFKNATYHLQYDHLESARHPNIRERASFFSDNFEPLATTGQLITHGEGAKIFPGIELLVVHGHTTSQQLVKISGKEGTLVFCADLLPTIHHLRGPWVMAYDIRPLVTVEEKDHFLREALKHQWQLFFEHDPDVSVASVCETPKGISTCSHRSLNELI